MSVSLANQLKAQLPANNKGLTDIEIYQGMNLPEDYEITELLGDVIMAEYVDCSDDGTEVIRDGIYINNDLTRNTWRVAKIVLHGKGCSDIIEVDKLIMFPNDKGIPCVLKGQGKKPRVFLNEERIFGVCKPKKKK